MPIEAVRGDDVANLIAARDMGVQDRADVTITVSYEDAASMSRGDLAPAEALNAGRIRVRGDLAVLVAAQEILAAARAATVVLDSSTTY